MSTDNPTFVYMTTALTRNKHLKKYSNSDLEEGEVWYKIALIQILLKLEEGKIKGLLTTFPNQKILIFLECLTNYLL